MVSLDLTVHAPTVNKGFAGLVQRDAMVVAGVWARQVRQVAMKYPRKRYNQVYKRTFKLKGGWEIEGPRATPDGVQVAVVNNVPYVEKVHGDKAGHGQSHYHVGRWKTQPEILATQEDLATQIQASINRRISQFFVR